MLADPGRFYQLFHERRLEVARGLLDWDRAISLDVGCGAGFLRSIGLLNIVGMDVRATRAVTVRASAENLPFRDQVFEQVFAGEVLEHLNMPGRALDEWVRVLREGGKLGLSTPNGRLVGLEGNCPEHKHVFTAGDLKRSLAARGINHLRGKSIFFGLVSGRRVFRFLPLKSLKLFLLYFPVPSALAYDLFLSGVKEPVGS